jgi:hypothetical protein
LSPQRHRAHREPPRQTKSFQRARHAHRQFSFCFSSVPLRLCGEPGF